MPFTKLLPVELEQKCKGACVKPDFVFLISYKFLMKLHDSSKFRYLIRFFSFHLCLSRRKGQILPVATGKRSRLHLDRL